jgi:hypothetical protein
MRGKSASLPSTEFILVLGSATAAKSKPSAAADAFFSSKPQSKPSAAADAFFSSKPQSKLTD